jgi:glycogen operon protein
MEEEHWGEGFAKAVGVFLNGEAIDDPDPRGERIVDDSFYVLFNAHHEALRFVLLKENWGKAWTVVLDTAGTKAEEQGSHKAGEEVSVEARSLKVLRRVT